MSTRVQVRAPIDQPISRESSQVLISRWTNSVSSAITNAHSGAMQPWSGFS